MDATKAEADDNGRPTSIVKASQNIKDEKQIDINANPSHVLTQTAKNVKSP